MHALILFSYVILHYINFKVKGYGAVWWPATTSHATDTRATGCGEPFRRHTSWGAPSFTVLWRHCSEVCCTVVWRPVVANQTPPTSVRL
jgi:hypothetical protein